MIYGQLYASKNTITQFRMGYCNDSRMKIYKVKIIKGQKFYFLPVGTFIFGSVDNPYDNTDVTIDDKRVELSPIPRVTQGHIYVQYLPPEYPFNPTNEAGFFLDDND